VVPEENRKEIMCLANDSKMNEHLGAKKISNMILAHFYPPNIRRDVVEDCISCNICQVLGKPNQNIRVAPLRPVPVSEQLFFRVFVDCVGPFLRLNKETLFANYNVFIHLKPFHLGILKLTL
jgi:hypothetical protein